MGLGRAINQVAAPALIRLMGGRRAAKPPRWDGVGTLPENDLPNVGKSCRRRKGKILSGRFAPIQGRFCQIMGRRRGPESGNPNNGSFRPNNGSLSPKNGTRRNAGNVCAKNRKHPRGLHEPSLFFLFFFRFTAANYIKTGAKELVYGWDMGGS